MSGNAVVDQLIKNLAFEVEATPQEDVLQVTNAGNSTSLNVKIRVRKKNKRNATVRQGVITVPQSCQPDSSPERVRLASSEQTIMSFNMWMEADAEKKPRRKTKRKLFGLCLGTHSEDDDSQYLPSTADNNICNRSHSGILKVEVPVLNNISDTYNSFLKNRKEDKKFFGKCKPGGCLDPPFGEEKYAYQHKPSRLNAPAPKIIELDNLEKESLLSEKVIDTHKLRMKKEIPSSSSAKVIAKEDYVNSSILSLYQRELNNMLEENESDSLITYPPTFSSNGSICVEENNEKNMSRTSGQRQPRKSFNEFSTIYYSPPKIPKDLLVINKTSIIPGIKGNKVVKCGDVIDHSVKIEDKRKNLQSTSQDDILLESLLSNEYKSFVDHAKPYKEKNVKETKQKPSEEHFKASRISSNGKLVLQDDVRTSIFTTVPLIRKLEQTESEYLSIGQEPIHSRPSMNKFKLESAMEGLILDDFTKKCDVLLAYNLKASRAHPNANLSIATSATEKILIKPKNIPMSADQISTAKTSTPTSSGEKHSEKTSEHDNEFTSNNQQSLHARLSTKESIPASLVERQSAVSSKPDNKVKTIDTKSIQSQRSTNESIGILVAKKQTIMDSETDNIYLLKDQKSLSMLSANKLTSAVSALESQSMTKLNDEIKYITSDQKSLQSLPSGKVSIISSKPENKLLPRDQISLSSQPSAKESTKTLVTKILTIKGSMPDKNVIPTDKKTLQSRSSTKQSMLILRTTAQPILSSNEQMSNDQKSLHSRPGAKKSIAPYKEILPSDKKSSQSCPSAKESIVILVPDAESKESLKANNELIPGVQKPVHSLTKQSMLISTTTLQPIVSPNERMSDGQILLQSRPSAKKSIIAPYNEIIPSDKISLQPELSATESIALSVPEAESKVSLKVNYELMLSDHKRLHSRQRAKESTPSLITEEISVIPSSILDKDVIQTDEKILSEVESMPIPVPKGQSIRSIESNGLIAKDNSSRRCSKQSNNKSLTKEEQNGGIIYISTSIYGKGIVKELLKDTVSYLMSSQKIPPHIEKNESDLSLTQIIENVWLKESKAVIPNLSKSSDVIGDVGETEIDDEHSKLLITKDYEAVDDNVAINEDLKLAQIGDQADYIKMTSPSPNLRQDSIQVTKSEFEKQIEYEISIHPLADIDNNHLIDNITFDITITDDGKSKITDMGYTKKADIIKSPKTEQKSLTRSPITEIDIPPGVVDIIQKAEQQLDEIVNDGIVHSMPITAFSKNKNGIIMVTSQEIDSQASCNERVTVKLYEENKIVPPYATKVSKKSIDAALELNVNNAPCMQMDTKSLGVITSSNKSPKIIFAKPTVRLSADNLRFGLLKTSLVQVKDKVQRMQSKDTILLDLAFQMSLKENKMVIKTLDSAVGSNKNNVILVKSLIQSQDKEIKVPIDAGHTMNITITPTVDTNFQSITKFDSGIGYRSVSAVSLGGLGSDLQTIISSIHDHELLPLQKVIVHLMEDIKDLAIRQLALKKALGSKKLRPTHHTSYKKCECSRH